MRLLTAALIVSSCVPAMAQRGGGGSLPQVGSSLPDVNVYDANGREFSLTELKGQYAVLVFGCLT